MSNQTRWGLVGRFVAGERALLGPFPQRSLALDAEVTWLEQNWLEISQEPVHGPARQSSRLLTYPIHPAWLS